MVAGVFQGGAPWAAPPTMVQGTRSDDLQSFTKRTLSTRSRWSLGGPQADPWVSSLLPVSPKQQEPSGPAIHAAGSRLPRWHISAKLVQS